MQLRYGHSSIFLQLSWKQNKWRTMRKDNKVNVDYNNLVVRNVNNKYYNFKK